jgi:NitT/TauT family transport system substrate-binding protein
MKTRRGGRTLLMQGISTFLILWTFLATSCSPKPIPPQALTPITVQLLWTHNSSFSGFYAADLNGYYQAEGLKVSFLEGGATTDLISTVLNGTAQFGDASGDQIIQARADGKPVKAIGVIDQRSPTVFVTRKESGITRPQEFVGKTIRSTSQIEILLNVMMARFGIQPDQYKTIPLPSAIASFEKGDAPVWGIYLNNFAVDLERSGHALNIIYPDDYGVHFYGDTLFTTDELIQKNPDLVLHFLRATLKGYAYAIENPEEAGRMTKVYNPQADIPEEIAKMAITSLLVNTGEDHIGWMNPKKWADMEDAIREQGSIQKPLDISQVYTMQFLDAIYGE